MIPLCPLQQPGHHSPLTDVFSLLPPLLSPSSLLPSLPPSPPSSLPLLPVTPPPLSATLQLFVDADNAHFRTEMVEYKRKQTITRAKQVPLTVAEQCTLSVLQCTLSVLQYTVMYYNICIHPSYNTSPPLPHPPPPLFPPSPSDFSGGRCRCACASFFRRDAGGECSSTLCHTAKHRTEECLQSRTYAGRGGRAIFLCS